MLDIAICDDEEEDLKIICNMLNEILAERNITFKLHSFVSPNKMIQELKKIDIGILDISMDELNGIELGQKIKKKFGNVKLLYITSFKDYCEQVINDVHAFSFLCKPLNKEKFSRQITEVVNQSIISGEQLERKFYNVIDSDNQEYMVKSINLSDIIYFEYIKSKRKIAIVLKDRTYEFSYVLQSLIDELEEYGFEVSCRGCLVNLRHILKIKGYIVYLDNGKTVPLSQKRGVLFKDKLNQFLCNSI
jgi:DNA-binding LytR/AlgR family response regulator